MKLLLITFLLFSFSCSPVKKYFDEGVTLKQGGISQDFTPCKLVEVKRTMKGHKHTFVSERCDTFYRTYQIHLTVGECYNISTLKNKQP